MRGERVPNRFVSYDFHGSIARIRGVVISCLVNDQNVKGVVVVLSSYTHSALMR